METTEQRKWDRLALAPTMPLLKPRHVDRTICALAAIIHAHIARGNAKPRIGAGFAAFIDPCEPEPEAAAPTLPPVALAEIAHVLRKVYFTVQMEPQCLVLCLVFAERLLSRFPSDFCLCRLTWRPTLLACLLISSKVHDDRSMVNFDFCVMAHPHYTLRFINCAEAALLSARTASVVPPLLRACASARTNTRGKPTATRRRYGG